MAKKHHNATHGMSGSPTYRSWEAMKRRCQSTNSSQYSYYGGRGITVCARWDSFEIFLSDMGERPQGMTLDRINPDENYSPDNCRWASRSRQSTNKRNNIRIEHLGKTMTLVAWAKKTGIHRDTLYQRYMRDGDRPPRLFRPVKCQRNNRPPP